MYFAIPTVAIRNPGLHEGRIAFGWIPTDLTGKLAASQRLKSLERRLAAAGEQLEEVV